ncbi:MAG: helix-turn-helix domain-containing protein [Methyloceanibacter sp.]|nr:helix-turn-helix domain-containing protein [Methyloceanibacter sp.]
MQQIFSTDSLDPADRFPYWMDVVSKNLIGIDSKIHVPNFSATIHVAPLAKSTVGLFELDDCELSHGAHHVSSAESDDVLIGCQIGGQLQVACGDHESELRRGDLCIIDSQRTYSQRLKDCKAVTIKLPRAVFEQRLGDLRALSWLKLPQESVVASLARQLIARLPQYCETLNDATAALLEGQIVDLITLAYLGGDGPPSALRTYARVFARFRLASTIESHLFDSRLKLADFAEKAGMTSRYANRLLASEGTSLERFLFERRLARSRAVLDSPVFGFRSLSEIAHSYGFTTQSHFSRKFKDEFGMTPSEYRRQRQQSLISDLRVSEARKLS